MKLYPYQQKISDALKSIGSAIIQWPRLCGRQTILNSTKELFEDRGLTRIKIKDKHSANPSHYCWEYTCKCGTVLTEGPEGGCDVNAVCKPCKINYGCLPGYYGD
jgi:hypothetical protein